MLLLFLCSSSCSLAQSEPTSIIQLPTHLLLRSCEEEEDVKSFTYFFITCQHGDITEKSCRPLPWLQVRLI